MRSASAVRAMLAVALLVAAFAGIGTVRTDRVAAALPDWQPYIEAGKATALALTTVDYRTVDRDVQRILDGATGQFYDSFKGRSAGFTQVVLDAKSTSTSTVSDAKLESHEDGRARVFVATDVTTTNAVGPDPPPRSWRLLITVEKVGESYKASQVQFLP